MGGSEVSNAGRRYNTVMETKRFIYYEEDGKFVGWFEEYPDYRTQGRTMDDLRQNLVELHKDFTSGQIPHIRRVGELSVA